MIGKQAGSVYDLDCRGCTIAHLHVKRSAASGHRASNGDPYFRTARRGRGKSAEEKSCTRNRGRPHICHFNGHLK